MATVPSNSGGLQQKYAPRGYHRLAKIMSRDRTLAIFRRFDDVLMLSILSLQAEIMDLQSRYQYQAEQNDQSSTESEKLHSVSFAELRRSKEMDGEQLGLLQNMREKIKEYNELLLQASQIAALEKPSRHDFGELQGWLEDPKGGGNFQTGSELRIWHDSRDPDFGRSKFVSVAPSVGENDIFTKRFTRLLTGSFHHSVGEKLRMGKVIDEESGLRSYNDSNINQMTSIITTILSSILPVITILILYQIQTPYGRIGATIGFTAIFAAALALFSTARRVEILAATATFAAVEVVFIGSTLGNKS